jgi:hypothetical protein
MQTSKRSSVFLMIPAIMFASLMVMTHGIAADDVVEVTLADLGTRIQIRGFLGKRLGEPMTARGSWSVDPDVASKTSGRMRLKITHVDGEKLSKPVVYDEVFVKSEVQPKDDINVRDSAVWEYGATRSSTIRMGSQKKYDK